MVDYLISFINPVLPLYLLFVTLQVRLFNFKDLKLFMTAVVLFVCLSVHIHNYSSVEMLDELDFSIPSL